MNHADNSGLQKLPLQAGGLSDTQWMPYFFNLRTTDGWLMPRAAAISRVVEQ